MRVSDRMVILSDGNTNDIGQAIFDEFVRSGHSGKHFQLQDMNIKPCYACRGCEEKTFMRCIHRDDADLILPYILRLKTIVVVTQITYGSFSFHSKRLMDKFLLTIDKHYGYNNGELVAGAKPTEIRFYGVGIHNNASKEETGAFETLVNATLRITTWEGKSIVTSSPDANRIIKEILS